MDDPNQQMNSDVGFSSASSGQITVAALVLIVIIFTVVLIIYLRSRGYSGTTGSSRSRRFVFAPHEPTLPRHALDPSILNSLPTTIFRSKDSEEGSCHECAVCLCELEDGEEVRLLPKCSHGFHVECIDMWFHSNNTCPLCRSLVNGETSTTASTEASVEIPIEPLDAALEAGSSSNDSSCAAGTTCSRKRKEGMLAIDIPTRTRMVGAFSSSSTPLPSSSKVPSNSPLPTSRLLEEIKYPALGRMKSLKRALSRGKASFMGSGSCYSPVGCDVEQGGLADSKRQ